MKSDDTKSSSYNEAESFSQSQNTSSANGQELQISDLKSREELSQFKERTDFNNDSKSDEIIESEKEVESVEFKESEIDKNLHDEILEKLDIKPKDKKQDIQEKLTQETLKQEAYLNKVKGLEKSQTAIQVEKVMAQDFLKIQKLVKAGLISSAQGQNLKKQVLKKAFDSLVQTEKIKRNLLPALPQSEPANTPVRKNEIFEEFRKNNPDFFTSDGRKEVLDYLKSNDVIIGRDELNKISGIIRSVEKAAIDRYLQKAAHEKILRDSNETAKQRLTANAQKSSLSGNLSRTFTREQIGKMSSAEFTKYESAIMEQLKKGLIK